MKESKVQKNFIDRVKVEFPGCIVMKNDANYIQGIPDLLILYGNRWAAIEVKKEIDSPIRPNQRYWIEKMNKMSYAQFTNRTNIEATILKLKEVFKNEI